MRVLATAKPSQQYRWYRSLESTKLEARLINNTIRYYEICRGEAKNISEALVESLFPVGCLIKDRPFLARENKDFYIVLNRRKTKYKRSYKRLKRVYR